MYFNKEFLKMSETFGQESATCAPGSPRSQSGVVLWRENSRTLAHSITADLSPTFV